VLAAEEKFERTSLGSLLSRQILAKCFNLENNNWKRLATVKRQTTRPEVWWQQSV